jgi:hypothetical protein
VPEAISIEVGSATTIDTNVPPGAASCAATERIPG